MFVSGDPRIDITGSREQGVDMFVSSWELRIDITIVCGVNITTKSSIVYKVYDHQSSVDLTLSDDQGRGLSRSRERH